MIQTAEQCWEEYRRKPDGEDTAALTTLKENLMHVALAYAAQAKIRSDA